MNSVRLAEENLAKLRDNPYPGRGMILGVDESGKNLIQIYWIMGRSPKSRNRIFFPYGGVVKTEIADSTKLEPNADLSLIVYDAMLEVGEMFGKAYIVSNGHQTNSIGKEAKKGLDRALSGWEYEPDRPNFTPRISGMSHMVCGQNIIDLSVLRKSAWGSTCNRFFYSYSGVEPGFGFCVTTYSGDGDPLPSFRGEPRLMPLIGNISTLADTYWETLNQDNRVALAIKLIPVNGDASHVHVINRFIKQ